MIQTVVVVGFFIFILFCAYCSLTGIFREPSIPIGNKTLKSLLPSLAYIDRIKYYKNQILLNTDIPPECKLHEFRLEITKQITFHKRYSDLEDSDLMIFDYYFDDDLTEIPPDMGNNEYSTLGGCD